MVSPSPQKAKRTPSLELAEALRQVDAWHGLGTEGQASALLTTPHLLRTLNLLLAKSPTQPTDIREGKPKASDCDEYGYCWWYDSLSPGEVWEYLPVTHVRNHRKESGSYRWSHWLPYFAIPRLPKP